jgi:hypothetical protein
MWPRRRMSTGMCGETSAVRAAATGDCLVSSALPVSLACWVGIGMVPTAVAPATPGTANKPPEKSRVSPPNPMQKHRLRPHPTSGISGHFPGLFGWSLDVARSRPWLATPGGDLYASQKRSARQPRRLAHSSVARPPSAVQELCGMRIRQHASRARWRGFLPKRKRGW